MATQAQIEANQKNAALSSGPKTDGGRARSRFNATKHGLAAESPDGEAGRSPEFEARRARWAAEHPTDGEAGAWAYDRFIAASLRIERCERAVDHQIEASRQRAQLVWDEDRRAEAATLAARLAKDPVLVSRQLQTSFAGVELMVEAWLGLTAVLQQTGEWTDAQASMALDLFGVAVDLRSGRTLLDPPDGADSLAYRNTLALGELERLEALRDESLAPLDDLERQDALAGDLALLSKPARLLLRYERDAWRQYRESMKMVKAHAQPRDEAEATPTPTAPPRVEPKPPEPKPSADRPTPTVAVVVAPAPVTERTQFVPAASDADRVWSERLMLERASSGA